MEVNTLKGATEKYLNDAAKKAVATVIKHETSEFLMVNEKSIGLTYFGTRVAKENIELGAEKLAAKINKLADEGKIIASLTPEFFTYDLARVPGTVDNTLVLMYVYLDADLKLKLESEDESFRMGGCPEAEEDLKLRLDDGYFWSAVSIPTVEGDTEFIREQKFYKEIETIKALLPGDTTVSKRTKCADISTSYITEEIVFHNELFKDIKNVQLTWNRNLVELPEGRVEQFNMITEVLYRNAEGKELWGR